ncbi:MAG TPA: sulfatase [Gemmatimonadales bacterium]
MTRREAIEGGLLAPFCLAMAGAALTIVRYFIVRFVTHGIVFSGLDVLWITPAGYVLLLLVASLPLAILLALSPRPLFWRALVFCSAWLMLYNVGLLFRQIWPIALMVLSAGCAWRIAVAAGLDPSPLLPKLRRLAGISLALPAVGLICARVAPPLLAHQRIARLAPLPDSTPNVLLLIIDTERAQNLSLYGYSRPTSRRLDTLARSSTVFDWAIAAAPWTLASHASMFSGLPASQTSVRRSSRPFTDDVPRLADVLRNRGFATGGFAANFTYAGPASGLERGFITYLHRPVNLGRIIRATPFWQTPVGIRLWRQAGLRGLLPVQPREMIRNFFPEGPYWSGAQICQAFLDWQRSTDGHPFFAFLNLLDVHEYHRPGRLPDDVWAVPANLSGYDDAMAYDDSVVGAMLDTLAARGVLDHTLLVVTADHGEQFLEHHLRGHSNSLYAQLVHVPLLMRYPGVVPSGLRVTTTVSGRDLAATIADLTHLRDAPLPGLSIAETWRRPAAARPPALSEVERDRTVHSESPAVGGALRSLVDADWHYIWRADGTEWLFRYREDTGEERNVVADPANAGVLARMRTALQRIPFGY